MAKYCIQLSCFSHGSCMQIMLEKNLVSRNTDSRTHIYNAAVKERETQRQLLDHFVDAAYRGSASRLVLQLLGNRSATQEELDEIKARTELAEAKRKEAVAQELSERGLTTVELPHGHGGQGTK